MRPRARRVVGSLVLVLGLLAVSAAPAGALPLGQGIHIPLPPIPGAGSLANSICGGDDAPMPASPYGDGNWLLAPLGTAMNQAGTSVNGKAGTQTGDPFTDPNVTLEGTYGSTPQWFTYDNGCSGFIDSAGTALGNIELELAGTGPNWSQALLDAVINPTWAQALDAPVKQATAATKAGIWGPWVGMVLLLVALVVMWRSREGRLHGSISAVAWALGVLFVVSFLTSYPLQSVHMVDGGVQSATGYIAEGFTSAGADSGAASGRGTSAQSAVDAQMDAVVRMTQYRTWLAGVFGSADSATAKKYGPAVFEATHFTWSEYDTYKSDPEAGKKIVEAKQARFKQLADEIKNSDPVAYEYFRGKHWSSRASLAFINMGVVLVVCGFLLVAGLAILLAFTLIRLLVPFSPAAGVLFMLDHTRDAAVGLLKKVAGPLVMGPVYFVVALLLLRFDSALLTADMWWILRIGLIAGLTWIAWKICRPQAYGLRVPGMGRLTNMLGSYLGARAGTADGAREMAIEQRRGESPPQQLASHSTHGMVHMPAGNRLPLDPAPTTYAVEQLTEQSFPGGRGALTAAQPGAARMLGAAHALSDSPDGIDVRELVAARPVLVGSLAEPDGMSDAPVDNHMIAPVPVVTPYDANVEYDDGGNRVYRIWSPDGTKVVPVDAREAS